MDKKIIQRVKALMAMADPKGGASANEQAVAMAKAQTLIERHSLTQTQLDAAEVCEHTAEAKRRYQYPDWAWILIHAINNAFGTDCYTQGHGDPLKYQVHFYGHDPMPELAGYCFEVLYRQAFKARQAYARTNLKRIVPHHKAMRADIYAEGWANTAVSKLHTLHPSRSQQRAMDAYKQETGVNPYKERQKAPTPWHVAKNQNQDRTQGYHDGQAVEINHGISGVENRHPQLTQ
ncbi:DUF2786 domain-containing protein [Magnetococcus sp. PR-3]|uniref:DUF2786 domain-containing protein n=1 Tax=Magnetococcus sp. PR-3 TaxID=3120355 RepID=UPI002FCE3265